MNILKRANLNDNLFSWTYVSDKSFLNSLKMIKKHKGKIQDNSYFINRETGGWDRIKRNIGRILFLKFDKLWFKVVTSEDPELTFSQEHTESTLSCRTTSYAKSQKLAGQCLHIMRRRGSPQGSRERLRRILAITRPHSHTR